MKSSIILIALAISIPVYAVDNLRMADIRGLGMGGNGATQSVLFNPALTTLSTHKAVHIDYFNRYSMKELGTVHMGFIYPNALLSAGVDICSFGYDKYRESMFRLSVGKKLSEKWRVGVAVQYALLQSELFEETPMRLSTDLGALFSPVDKLLIGMLVMNVPSVALGRKNTEMKGFMSYSVQISFQWEVINTLLIVGTAESNKEVTLTGSAGMEYRPFKRFHIRAGIQATPLLPTFGIGYRFSRFTVDVAAVCHPLLGISTGLGLKYTF